MKLIFTLILIIISSLSTAQVHTGTTTLKEPRANKTDKTNSEKPIQQQTSQENTVAKILQPANGSSFKDIFEVKGSISNYNGDGHLWLITRPAKYNACYPHFHEIIPMKREWSGTIQIGGDPGEEHKVYLIKANREANEIFNKMILNDKYTQISMPEGVTYLDEISVFKAGDMISHKQECSPKYGFSKEGVFFLHKSLISGISESVPCLVTGVTKWTNKIAMQSIGDYFIYTAKVDRPFQNKLLYCFYLPDIGLYIPQLLLENSSSLINPDDIQMHPANDGSNFFTSPIDYLPSDLRMIPAM